MSPHGAAPAQDPFLLGPEGFIVHAEFVLAESHWKMALAYCNALAAISTEDISFSDVRLYIANLQASARTWRDDTYPSEVVSLADAVVHYATQTGVYYPALAQALAALGKDPINAELLKQVNAILQLLNKAPSEQSSAAEKAAEAAGRFVSGATAGEKKLRVLFDDYANIYLTGSQPRAPILEGLDHPVIALDRAWTRLSSELLRLKEFVDAHAAGGELFSIDIAASSAIAQWKTAGDAADNWRKGAFSA
jgi:hypothetical protein